MQEILVSELNPHSKNDYFFDDMSGDKWEEFVESVRTSGVIEPIVITQDKVIVSGHQRVRACKELGITSINAEVRIYDDEDAIIKDLLETNVRQRGNIGGSTVKLGRRIKELERIYGVRNGAAGETRSSNGTWGKTEMTEVELASKLGIDINTLKRAKLLVSLPQEIQDFVESGNISPSTASRLIARLSPEEQEQLAASLPATEKLTQKQVQQYIRDISDRDSQIGEQADKLDKLERRNKELEVSLSNAAKPETITIDNTDYSRIEQLESKVRQLESQKRSLEMQSKMNQEDAKKFKKLKSDIEFLTQQKSDLSRQIDSATQLAELTVTLQTTLERDLAPIKFMRCMERLDISDVARQNLVDIVNLVDKWSAEMHSVLSKENIVMVDYGGTENR